MIYYIFGIITGLWLASFLKKNSEQVGQIINKITPQLPKNKAEFFEIGDTELDAMEELYKENEKRGRDTELKDL